MKISKTNIVTRLLAFAALMLTNAGVAMAAHTVSISDFSISVGEQKTLEINLASDKEDIIQIAGTITLPEGLKFVAISGTDYIKVDSRTNGATGILNIKNGNINISNYGFNPFTGAEGAVAKIKVEATSELAETATITLSEFNIWHVDKSSDPCDVSNATVTRSTNNLSVFFTQDALSIFSGETKTVDVKIANDMALAYFESTIEISEGLTIVDAESEFEGFSYEDGYVYIEDIAAGEGVTFTITVKAADEFTGAGTITLTEPAAKPEGKKKVTLDDLVLNVTVEEALPNEFKFGAEEISLTYGEPKEVTVIMTSAVDLTGFESTLVLPEGVTAKVIKSERIANEPTYTPETGKISYLGPIKERKGTLITLELTAGDGFSSTGGTLKLENINGTTAKAANIEFAAISLNVKNVTPTAIDMVKSQNSNAAVYDLQGRRVSVMSKGLYIINGKKVIR